MKVTPELVDQIAAALADHVGASRLGVERETYVHNCAAEALELVASIVGGREVPNVIIRRAAVEAGADLFWRRQARNGIASFEADGAIETVRVGLDPTRAARAVLSPWLGMAIA